MAEWQWSTPVALSQEQFMQEYVLARADNDTLSVNDDVALALEAWLSIKAKIKETTNGHD